MCVVGLAVALGQFEMWACSADNLLRRGGLPGVSVLGLSPASTSK